MNRQSGLGLVAVVALALFSGTVAVGAAEATPEPVQLTGTGAQIVVLSNSSPHVSVIDAETRRVVATADLPGFTAWTWNDANNHFDGRRLWLGLRDPDSSEVEVIALDLDQLTIARRIPLGSEPLTLYIGKASAAGEIYVTKMGSGQVVAIDAISGRVRASWDVPVNGDVACDADVSIDALGRERFIYPTRKGDTIIALDPATGQVVEEVATPAGTTPLMLTTGRDGTILVEESGSNTVALYDRELNLIERTPTGTGPIDGVFSPDGTLAFVGHSSDTVVTVFDTQTLTEVARIEAGTNPEMLAVDPAGREAYAILTKEAAVAVIDIGTWEVVDRIPLGTNPSGIFLWQR